MRGIKKMKENVRTLVLKLDRRILWMRGMKKIREK
jgi:hypothetical protein